MSLRQRDKFSLIHNSLFLLLFAFLIAFGFGCSGTQMDIEAAPIRWRTLAEGKAEAQALGLPYYVDFYYGEECSRCMEMQRKIYANRAIASRLSELFVPIRIDLKKKLTEGEAALMKKLGARGECVFAFLHPNGQLMLDADGRTLSETGNVSAHKFSMFLDDALSSEVRVAERN